MGDDELLQTFKVCFCNFYQLEMICNFLFIYSSHLDIKILIINKEERFTFHVFKLTDFIRTIEQILGLKHDNKESNIFVY